MLPRLLRSLILAKAVVIFLRERPCTGRGPSPNQKSLETPYVTAPIQAALMATASLMPACGQAIRKASIAFVTIDALPQSPRDVASLPLRECDCKQTPAMHRN